MVIRGPHASTHQRAVHSPRPSDGAIGVDGGRAGHASNDRLHGLRQMDVVGALGTSPDRRDRQGAAITELRAGLLQEGLRSIGRLLPPPEPRQAAKRFAPKGGLPPKDQA
eukprot:406169-Alexandrium_andersonii.AAC.1